jgi:CDP-glucose 4,6-dehydratase
MPADGVTSAFWRGRRVFVTGHTGFMGGWLCAWLTRMGADVHGYALPAPTQPSFYDTMGLAGAVDSTVADVRDLERLCTALRQSKAEVVFHLAAQPLVRQAYANPVETYAVNVMGTVHLLEAMRRAGTVQAAVIVTTDKVYENQEWPWGYREADTLGGREPYGNSKACAELAVDAYRRSFFAGSDAPAIATVRAGNIIGGGDWAVDRLVPDAVRAFSAGKALEIRHPDAVRPWQHALDPVRGFLMLAERLAEKPSAGGSAWNFGPPEDDARAVGWIADRLARHWGMGVAWHSTPSNGPHEARLLMLNSAKAKTELGWTCRWDADMAIRRTVEWYRTFYDADDVRALTDRQIASFDEDGKSDDKHGKKTVRGSNVRESVVQF